MLRAVAIDHASRSLAAEARARARLRDNAIEEAEGGISRHSAAASDRAAKLAAQDHVGTRMDAAMATQRPDMSLAAASPGMQRSQLTDAPIQGQGRSARR
jgi:hypothetical protein